MAADGLIFRCKLTKKFFMGLPDNAFLSSNTFDRTGHPMFAEQIVPKEQREEQWQQIKGIGVDQKLCNVFKNKSCYAMWHDEIPGPLGSGFDML